MASAKHLFLIAPSQMPRFAVSHSQKTISCNSYLLFEGAPSEYMIKKLSTVTGDCQTSRSMQNLTLHYSLQRSTLLNDAQVVRKFVKENFLKLPRE